MISFRSMSLASLCAAALAVAGCSDAEDSVSSTITTEATATATATPEAPKPGSVADVEACIENLGYTLSDAGNARRIASPAGRDVGNLQSFGTVSEAAEFYDQLEVDGGYQGGRHVAVWFVDAKDDERDVITADCLTADPAS